MLHHIFVNIYIYLSLYVLECPLGYHLINCSEKCSAPYYGDNCQSVCQCSNVYCQFDTGCSQDVNSYKGYQPQGILFYMRIIHLSNYVFLLYTKVDYEIM